MFLRTLLVYLFFLLCSCGGPMLKNPHIVISTKEGNIELELYIDQAPASVHAFLSYIDSGFYKRASFYRVLNTSNQPSDYFKAELIQGGIWRKNRKKAVSLPGIPHESTLQTKISHKDGIISLAREAPGTATTEFFICIGDQPGFDYGGENNPDGKGYAAFGKVVEGMNVVMKIYNQPEHDQSFEPQVEIYDIHRR